MADPVRGKLVWQGKGEKRVRRVIFPTKKGMSIPTPVDADQLATSLRTRPEDEIEVDLEVISGKPVRIRPVGEPFTTATTSSQKLQGMGIGGKQTQAQKNKGKTSPKVGDFHNPYNFVPALPRDSVKDELGDHKPAGHHVLHADHYTGVIRVKMTVKTPLLVLDAAQKSTDANGHDSFPLRIDAEGKPYIPPTSIKGMLRTAYEAVTNSRLAVFPGHEDRLADRMPARDGLALVPARIIDGNMGVQVELLPGNSAISSSGKPTNNDPMYAAWLPRYRQSDGTIASFAIRYPNNDLPEHGDHVEVWLELWERTGTHPFDYWSVRKCVRAGESLGQQPQRGQPRGSHRPVQGVGMIKVFGEVCITNRNINRKHDERVFFTTRNEPVTYPLTDELCRQWRELITNYQSIHQEERCQGMEGPPALNNSVWSRQVVGGQQERELAPGTLCYAAFRDGQVTALFPVMISRRLFECSPLYLLPESLRPATSLELLSPADRVFGWVNQRGKGAYKGNLRIGPVTCGTNDAIENFDPPGLPLAILGQPKPQQARFYVGKNQNGDAQDNCLSKEQAGYSPGKGLRGRKVYPHHNGLPSDHWDPPTEDRTQQANNGHFQEYRRPDSEKVRDNQNRSILGWVRPNTEFTFDIHVTNLSTVELGALLWLLSLPENHFHRFGGGKPLGFGSVQVEIESLDLRDGKRWKEVYSTLDDFTPNEVDRSHFIEEYKKAVQSAYGQSGTFDQVPFIAAWLRMATGHPEKLPTHYPRVSRQPDPAGENFRWFTGNESGQRVCLGNLENDTGLPLPNTSQ